MKVGRRLTRRTAAKSEWRRRSSEMRGVELGAADEGGRKAR